MKRLLAVAAGAAFALGGLVGADIAAAKDPDKGPPGQGQEQGQPEDKGKGGAEKEKKAHKHAHKSGKDLLGAKLKKDGKHNVGKAGKHDVMAEVKKGKVVNMSAGDLPVKRVKTKEKMASLSDAAVRLAALGPFQLAQYDDWYYGYCFEDEYDYYCYWYTEDEVDYDDYEWEDYDPYY